MGKTRKKRELTKKQAEFALQFVECGNASEAYRRAYDVGESTKPATVWRHAHGVANNDNVRARIEELREKVKQSHVFTVDMAVQEYDEARALALKCKHSSAAVTATAHKAKILGMDAPQRVENTVKVETRDRDDDDWARRMLHALREVAEHAKDKE